MTDFIKTAVHRLASAHGHEWAGTVTLEEWLASSLEEAIELARQRQSDYWPGLAPAMSHTTGSGRLTWVVEPVPGSPDDMQLTVEINRPGRGGFETNRVVARATWTAEGDTRPPIIDWDAIELRHLVCLYEVIEVAEGRLDRSGKLGGWEAEVETFIHLNLLPKEVSTSFGDPAAARLRISREMREAWDKARVVRIAQVQARRESELGSALASDDAAAIRTAAEAMLAVVELPPELSGYRGDFLDLYEVDGLADAERACRQAAVDVGSPVAADVADAGRALARPIMEAAQALEDAAASSELAGLAAALARQAEALCVAL